MMLLAVFMLLADGLVSIPPASWQAIRVDVPQHGTIVDCDFRVLEGTKVQAMLVSRHDAERFHRGRSVRPLYNTGFEESGRFRYYISEAGEYVLLIDNRIAASVPALVKLRIELLNPNGAYVRTLPPEKRRMVVALSLLFFGIVVTFSARQYFKQQQ
jgi:hypothetical protein